MLVNLQAPLAQQPIHISYGFEHKRAIWTFTEKGMPTKKGIENWVKLALLYIESMEVNVL